MTTGTVVARPYTLDVRGIRMVTGDRVLIKDPTYQDEGLEGVISYIYGARVDGDPFPMDRSDVDVLVSFLDPEMVTYIYEWFHPDYLEAVADLDPSCGPPVTLATPYVPMVGDVVGGLESAPCGLAGKTGYVSVLATDLGPTSPERSRSVVACQVVIDNGPVVWVEPNHLDLIYPAFVPMAADDD